MANDWKSNKPYTFTFRLPKETYIKFRVLCFQRDISPTVLLKYFVDCLNENDHRAITFMDRLLDKRLREELKLSRESEWDAAHKPKAVDLDTLYKMIDQESPIQKRARQAFSDDSDDDEQ